MTKLVISDAGGPARRGRHLTRHAYPDVQHVMVVYSKLTGVTRRIIDADDEREYQAYIGTLHPGEGYVLMTHADYDAHHSSDELTATVAKHAGFATPPPRHADRHAIVAPNGRVIGACHADPSCGDSGEHIAPGHRLVPHEHAGVGWIEHPKTKKLSASKSLA